ncbi:GGDEF domain-containing protein [Marinobacter hydrocarbonoclasticus]|nr:GGDEF domain-containing protein [Marinobacter nauticus]
MRLATQLILLFCALILQLSWSPIPHFAPSESGQTWQEASRSAWSIIPSGEGWVRRDFPAGSLTRGKEIYLGPTSDAPAKLWLLQDGKALVSIDSEANSAEARVPFPLLDSKPFALILQGSDGIRFGITTVNWAPGPLWALAIGLIASALLLASLQQHLLVLPRIVAGLALVALPMLNTQGSWLVLSLLLLLFLPSRWHGWIPVLAGILVVSAFFSFPMAVWFPLVLLPIQLWLLWHHTSQSHHWRCGQLLLLTFFSLERLPAPTLEPGVLMAVALIWPVLIQLELSQRLSRRLRQSHTQRPDDAPQESVALKEQLKRLQWENRLLKEKSTTDPLTGLRNRQYFNEHYRREVGQSARHDTPISLLLMDLDHFKAVNDTYGHPIGDHVLQEVAKRAYYTLRRPADALCRIGGEEFAILLPQTNENGARHVADTLLKQLGDEAIRCGDLTLNVTASIGVATLNQRPQMIEMELMRRADAALYRAKALGRNRVECALANTAELPTPEVPTPLPEQPERSPELPPRL